MAASAYTDTVQKVYIAYYGRAADPVGLAYWSKAIDDAGGSLDAIMTSFGTSAEATTLYGSLSNSAKVNAIYQQSFGRDADFAGLMYYSGQLSAGTMTAASIAQNIFDGASGSDATILANKLIVAKAYTTAVDTAGEVIAYSGTVAAASARTLLATVDATTTTSGFDVDTSIAGIVSTANAVAVVAGTTYKLTSSTDNIVGTAGADTVNSVFTADAATGTTIAPGDSVSGGAGVDTLSISVAGAATSTALATLSAVSTDGVEKLHLSNFETSTFDHTVDTALMTGLTHVGLSSSSATGDVGFTNLKNLVEADMQNGSGDVTVTYATAVVAGTADTQTLNLANASAGTFTAAGVETVAINTSLLASSLTAVTATSMSKLTVAGDKDLSIAKTLDFAGTGTINGTVDASEFTGALTLDLSTAEVVSATGGSGADTFALAGTMTKADIIDGGAGSDTVSLTIGAETLDATAVTGELIGLSNVETVRLTSSDTTDGSTLNVAALTGVTDVSVAGQLRVNIDSATDSDNADDDVYTFTLNGTALSATLTTHGTNATSATEIAAAINAANLGVVATTATAVLILTPTTAAAVNLSAFTTTTSAGAATTSATDAGTDDHAVTVTNMTTQSATVLGGASNQAAATNAGVLDLSLTDASGLADTMTVNLSADAQNKAVDHSLDGLTTSNVESLTLTSNGLSAGNTQIVDALTGGAALTSLTITGSSALTITDHATSNTALATIDASEFTGNLTLSDAVVSLAQTITTGSGNDSIVMDGNLTAADVIDGGGNTLKSGVMGTDTLTASGAVGTSTAAMAAQIANVETIQFANGTSDVYLDAAGITGASNIAFSATSGTTTLTNLAADSTIGLGIAAVELAGTLSATLADETGTADSITLAYSTGTDTGATTVVKTAGIETVNIVATTESGGADTHTITTTNMAAANVVVTSGQVADTLALGTLNVATTSVDASAYLGILTVAGGTAIPMSISANGTVANTITTSTGSDTITLAGNLGTTVQDISASTGTLDVLNANADNASTDMTSIDGFETINLTIKASTAVGIDDGTKDDGFNLATTVNLLGGNSLSSFTLDTTGVIDANTAATTIDASGFLGNVALTAANGALNSFLTIKGGALTTDAVTTTVSTTLTGAKIAAMSGVETLTVNSTDNETASSAIDLANVTGLVTVAASYTTTTNADIITVNNVADGVNFKVTSTKTADNLVVGLTNATAAANSLNVEMTAITGALATVNLDVAGLETLNIASKDAEGTTVDLAGMSPTTGSTGTVNVTGAGATTLTALHTGINVINASAATGALTVAAASRDNDAYTITGGTASDTIAMENAADVLDAGAGTGDSLVVNYGAILGGLNVDLSKTDQVVSIDGGSNAAVQSNFESVDASGFTGFGSVIVGSDVANRITGTAGTDSISAGKGSDTIVVNTGTVADADIMNGGAGADTLEIAAGLTVTIDGDGDIASVETITFVGAGTVVLTGQTEDFTITDGTTDLDNIITGGSGIDTFASAHADDQDTFIFAATSGANGVDALSNFDATQDQDELDFDAFLGTIAVINGASQVAGADAAEGATLVAVSIGAENSGAGTDIDNSVIIFDKGETATDSIAKIQALITAAGDHDEFKLASGKKAVILHGNADDGAQDFDIYYVTGTSGDTESMVKVGVVGIIDGNAITSEMFGV